VFDFIGIMHTDDIEKVHMSLNMLLLKGDYRHGMTERRWTGANMLRIV